MHPALTLALTALGAYLVGGIPFGFLVARWRGVDIFRAGSGNLGATNVGRVLGRRFGVLVFLLDFAKGAVPAAVALAVARNVNDYGGLPPSALPVVAGLGAFLGHLFPAYLRFRGGKGVATGAGAVTVLLPLPALGAIIVWITVVCASRYVSLASLSAAAALCALHLALTPSPFDGDGLLLTSFCLLAVGLVIVRHRANVARLLHGNENRLRDGTTMHLLGKTLHVLAVGLWFGAAVFFSFIAAPSLLSTFEREASRPRAERASWFLLPDEYGLNEDTRRDQGIRAFGQVIGPLFGRYFLLQGVCGFVAAVTALGWARAKPGGRVHRARVWVVLLALGTVVVGWPLEHEVNRLQIVRNETGDRWRQGELQMLKTGAAPAGHQESLTASQAAKGEFIRWHLVGLMLNLVTVLLVTVVMALSAALPAHGGTQPRPSGPEA